jgi:hypothetical protein
VETAIECAEDEGSPIEPVCLRELLLLLADDLDSQEKRVADAEIAVGRLKDELAQAKAELLQLKSARE